MNHEISSRPLTQDEASQLKRSVRVGLRGQADDVGFFMTVAGGVTIIGIASAAAAVWLAEKLGFGGLGRLFAAALLIVGAMAGARVGIAAVRQVRRSRQLAERDIKERNVEVIRVENARLVQLEEHNDEGPLYCFGIGGGRVLFLGGQWLYEFYDEHTEEPRFPSSSFTVHRLPSGPVLRIEVSGEQLAPEAVLPRKVRLPGWFEEPFSKEGFLGNSLIFEGDFEELLGR